MEPFDGLSEEEARARRDRGEGNNISFGTSRSWWDIARANVFTLFNAVLAAVGALLVAVGHVGDALISIGPLFVANGVLRTGQEIYAKSRLDAITLTGRTTITVVRDARERAIDPAELVRGDIVHLRAGDQVTADGTVLSKGRLEMDESLLTGESELIPKNADGAVLSGSFCAAGDGYYRAEKVGAESFTNQLAIAARKFEIAETPLQRKIDRAARIVMVAVVLMSVLVLLAALIEGLPLVRLLQISAVLTAQVPYGLFFMTVIAYALGAAVVARRGAVVQQANAIEALSSIDVLCMDKTGTLTANRLKYTRLQVAGGQPQDEIARWLGDFVRSVSSPNRTSQAIAAGIAGQKRVAVDEVPFESSRKWSAILCAADGEGHGGAFVLGALEALAPNFTGAGSAELADAEHAASAQGQRVLAFAYSPTATSLHDAAGQPRLPSLTPLAIVTLADELRPEAQDTIAEFTRLGISMKVISGDDPKTVLSLVRQAGFAADVVAVAGPDLDRMNAEEFGQTAERATVFGRISPHQKEALVEALISRGHRVAMIGDGINDILAVKKADLGIAMESGSSATRNVADMVLLKDSFAALRPAFAEGKRIVSGIESTLCLFLTRVSVATLAIVGISMLGIGFPFEPAQVALTYLTTGIPSIALILWARPDAARENFLGAQARFVLPAAVLTAVIGIALYAAFYVSVLTQTERTFPIPAEVVRRFAELTGQTAGVDNGFSAAAAMIVAQTVLSVFITVTAFLLILFLKPPFRFFTGWAEVYEDKRPALLAVGLFALLLVIILTPLFAYWVALFPLGLGAIAAIAGATVIWVFALRAFWRAHIFDRWFA